LAKRWVAGDQVQHCLDRGTTLLAFLAHVFRLSRQANLSLRMFWCKCGSTFSAHRASCGWEFRPPDRAESARVPLRL
jgi:hypothetical protein